MKTRKINWKEIADDWQEKSKSLYKSNEEKIKIIEGEK